MHVGVEKAVAQRLREEHLDRVGRQPLDVDAGLAHALDLADRHAVDALHDQHGLGAEIPGHLGDAQHPRALEVAAQLRGVGGLAHEVELVVQDLVELGHDLARAQALAVTP